MDRLREVLFPGPAFSQEQYGGTRGRRLSSQIQGPLDDGAVAHNRGLWAALNWLNNLPAIGKCSGAVRPLLDYLWDWRRNLRSGPGDVVFKRYVTLASDWVWIVSC